MPSKPVIIAFDQGDRIRISPPIFTDTTLKMQPGDLTKFAPHGNGVYGYQNRDGSTPFTQAPSQEACGGVIYFDNHVDKEDFMALMHIAGIQDRHDVNPSKDYAAFVEEAEEPGIAGYLTQMRIVSKFALRHMFDALDETGYKNFPSQDISIAEALWCFMEHERKRWGTDFGGGKLAGLFGGDGDFAQEELSFGFMIENSYFSIFRIWSRAWLVTK